MWVGNSSAAAEIVVIQPDNDGGAIGDLVVQAQAAGRLVEFIHPDNSAVVTSAALVSDGSGQFPIQMDAIEATQAVQDLAHSIPLVTGKRTVVRAYLSNYGANPVTVSAEVTVRQPGGGSVVIPSSNVATLSPSDAGNIVASRNDAARSLNFVLPFAAAGPVELVLTRVTDTTLGADLPIGSGKRPTVYFQTGAPFRVRIVGLSYSWGTPAITIAPVSRDYALLQSWLGRAYPASSVQSAVVTAAATAAPPFGCGDINAQIAALRAQDVNSGTDARTHYYGIVSDAGFFMRGCTAGIPSNPDPSVVASGPTGSNSWGWDFDGSYGDWYGGHEIGHTMGRLHPGFCGETADDLVGYPFPAGQLSTTDAVFGGFDVGDPANSLPMRALPGSQWHDVMTYCNSQWLSPYTYEGIRRRLVAENALPAGGGAGGGAGPGSGTGGRPDQRIPNVPLGTRVAPGAIPTAGTRSAGSGAPVHVVAQLNFTRRTGSIDFVNPVPNLGVSARSEGSRVGLLLRSSSGAASEIRAAYRINSDIEPGDDEVGLVDTVVSVPADTSVIELTIDGAAVAEFRPGPEPSAPPHGLRLNAAAGRLSVTQRLDGSPHPGHRFTVQTSPDGGRTWQTVAVGLTEPRVDLIGEAYEPGKELLVKVIATNGLTATETVDRVTIGDQQESKGAP
ncbi:hypothetical protein [Arthrobacter sp. UYEF21]|uniref:hypothetical protein n=1 Tax=Arthrobacter sp. UYEF21 TaxID=1756364 RepID=UPI003395A10C